MPPAIAIADHSVAFLCPLQRRLKREPLDVYLFNQNETCVDDMARIAPNLLVFARRYGYPSNDQYQMKRWSEHPTLYNTPIILLLMEGMDRPSPRPRVTVLFSPPDGSDMEQIVSVIHNVLKPRGSHWAAAGK